jgi:AsmA protein
MKKLAWILGGIIAIVLIGILVLPSLIDGNQFRPRIESSLATSLNRKVEIGNISLSIFSGGAVVDNISIADDPAFSRDPFLKAKSVKVGVELMPLILSKQLHVTAFTIDQPQVNLLRSPKGTWNYSTLGATNSKSKSAEAPVKDAGNSGMDLTVQRLTIENGKLFVGSTGPNTKMREYDDVKMQATDLSNTSQFPFTFSAKAPGNGAIKLEGKAGPLNRTDTQETPFAANLDVKDLDLASTGFVDPTSGLAGVIDFTGTLNSDGQRLDAKGSVNAKKLQLVPGGSPARVPVTVQFETGYAMKPQTGALKQGDVHLGKAFARLTGTFNASGEVASIQMKLEGQNMPAADLEGVLPAIGVTLPSGASLQTGALTANLTISGPVNRLVTTGPINLSNAKLAGFSLGSKLGGLAAFTGLSKNSGSDTTIQTLSSQLRVAPEGIRADSLNLIVEGIGTITGNGTISANHAMNFKLLAKLSGISQSPLGAIAGIAGIAGLGQKQGIAANMAANGIPFLIQGTTSNPVFVPDVAGLAKGLGNNAAAPSQQNLGGILGDLLKRKKP